MYSKVHLFVVLVFLNFICISKSSESKIVSRGRRDESFSPIDDYIFSLPDIITSFINEQNNKIKLTAFKTRYNDAIIKSKTEYDYGQLRWVSMGYPSLVPFTDTNQYFKSNNQHINAQVAMLTDEQVGLFKTAIQNKYRQLKTTTSIDDNQIIDMPLTEFKCNLKLKCFNFVLNGEVKNFFEFPLTLSFKVNETVLNFKSCIENNLFNESLKHTLECRVAQKVKLAKTNILTIDASQENKIELTNEIFGPADVKYVTRNQLDELSSRLISSLNLYEEFEFDDDEKDETYIRDEILKQTSIETFKSVPIKEALESLASFNINNDLSPDVITSDLSKIVSIVKRGSKEHILVDKEKLSNFMTRMNEKSSGSGGFSLGFKGFGTSVKGSGSKVNSTVKQDEFSEKSLNDQLYELNNYEENDVIFERKGEKIVPKSLKVAKLSRAKLSKKLRFKSIRQKLEKTFFQEKFDLIAFKRKKECLKTISCRQMSE